MLIPGGPSESIVASGRMSACFELAIATIEEDEQEHMLVEAPGGVPQTPARSESVGGYWTWSEGVSVSICS